MSPAIPPSSPPRLRPAPFHPPRAQSPVWPPAAGQRSQMEFADGTTVNIPRTPKQPPNKPTKKPKLKKTHRFGLCPGSCPTPSPVALPSEPHSPGIHPSPFTPQTRPLHHSTPCGQARPRQHRLCPQNSPDPPQGPLLCFTSGAPRSRAGTPPRPRYRQQRDPGMGTNAAISEQPLMGNSRDRGGGDTLPRAPRSAAPGAGGRLGGHREDSGAKGTVRGARGGLGGAATLCRSSAIRDRLPGSASPLTVQ